MMILSLRGEILVKFIENHFYGFPDCPFASHEVCSGQNFILIFGEQVQSRLEAESQNIHTYLIEKLTVSVELE